jgi:RNA recognition motif-containing protein
MSVRLFVGGLSFSTSSEGLRDAFARFGPVQSAAVMTDRETGRSRGFGFVEMAGEEEAERAISALNGSQLDGRMIRVDKATPRGSGPVSPRPPRPAGAARFGGGPPAGGPSRFGGPGAGGPGYGGGPGRFERPAGFGPPPGVGRGGQQRRGQGPGRPDDPYGRKKEGGRPASKKLKRDDQRGGRGRPGSDGEYRWGR